MTAPQQHPYLLLAPRPPPPIAAGCTAYYFVELLRASTWYMHDMNATTCTVPHLINPPRPSAHVPSLLGVGAGPVHRPGGVCPEGHPGSWGHTSKGLLAVSPGTATSVQCKQCRAEPKCSAKLTSSLHEWDELWVSVPYLPVSLPYNYGFLCA